MLKRLLRPYAGWLLDFCEFRRRRRREVPVGAGLSTGHVDHLLVHDDGVLAVEGWAASLTAFRDSLALSIGGRNVACTHAYRVHRPDLAAGAGGAGFLGAVVEWVLPPETSRQRVTLLGEERPILGFHLPPVIEPHYAMLRTEPHVLGRDRIYGFGPPVREVSPEVVALARTLPQPILDFGCGAGALVAALRQAGVEAYGLELDNERILGHMIEDVRSFITLYDGTLPAPFADGRFASVTCSEVLEHMPDPAAALSEIARLASASFMLTVPDMSAIPRCFSHATVPWHLLEATHVNFFTQASLTRAIAPHAGAIEVARIGRIRCDRTQHFTSLAVVAQRGRA